MLQCYLQVRVAQVRTGIHPQAIEVGNKQNSMCDGCDLAEWKVNPILCFVLYKLWYVKNGWINLRAAPRGNNELLGSSIK